MPDWDNVVATPEAAHVWAAASMSTRARTATRLQPEWEWTASGKRASGKLDIYFCVG